jgi:hypothetical protein
MTASTPIIQQRTRRLRPITADGHEVRLIAVEPQIAAPAQRGSDGRERSRYQVEVDGILRGHIVYIQSWYGSWEALSLGALTRQGGQPQRLNSLFSTDGTPYQSPTRDGLAARFPEWIAAGRAPSPDELAAYRRREEAARAKDDEDALVARREEDARRTALRTQIAAQKAEAHATASERIAILETLRARGASILSNAEIEALAWAIDQLGQTR